MTETVKHTPAPWISETTGSQPGAFSVTGDGNQLVALVYGDTREQQRVNGHLIAAAPDLLAALKTIDNDVRHHVRSDAIRASYIHPEAIIELRAAIAKAEGRTK